MLKLVQMRMTKMIQGLRNLPYEERLKQLNFHSKERRRVRGDMIEVYKWMKGLNKGDIHKVLLVREQGRIRRNGLLQAIVDEVDHHGHGAVLVAISTCPYWNK